MDYDYEEFRGIRDLEYLFGKFNEDAGDYKPERVENTFKNDTGDYNYIIYGSKGSKYYDSLQEYLSIIRIPSIPRKYDKKLHVYWWMDNTISN